MNPPPPNPEPLKPQPPAPIAVKVFGIGAAGLKILSRLSQAGPEGVTFAAVDTNGAAVAAAPCADKIPLEPRLLRGLGTGGDPERGRAAAEENLARLKAACEGAQVVFLVAGLGGGAGTGVGPVLARAARETGALVLAFVTLPFDCEGNRRRLQANQGLQEWKAVTDGVVCLPNQSLFKLIDENTTVLETFERANELLAEGIIGVWRVLARPGLIEIPFDELCALLRDQHNESAFAVAEAGGATRSREVVDRLLAHPAFDGGKVLAESAAVLVSLLGGPDLTMTEINRVMESISARCPGAQVLMGAAVDESFRERLALTVIAARQPESLPARAGFDEAAYAEAARAPERFERQLLDRTAGPRPHSRFVPPPPALPPDKVDQLRRRGTAGRTRKAARMRQGQLPLEIVSKGRFDKSEPTIHKGEDLDVPTYIRRGVLLN